jgi:hypothetical protein
MGGDVESVIVGAGPYGLSLAAHLNAAKAEFRIFGDPMSFWERNMPPGMFLKSDVYSSDIREPGGKFTIRRFLESRQPDRTDRDPISLASFVEYGHEFQRIFVPNLESAKVASIDRAGNTFRLQLTTGEVLHSAKVVLALGVGAFKYIPEQLAHLGRQYCTHSAQYGPIEELAGKRVAVLGSGASAIDLAAALFEHGIDTTLLCRRSSIAFQRPPFLYPALVPPTDSCTGFGDWLRLDSQTLCGCSIARAPAADFCAACIARQHSWSRSWVVHERSGARQVSDALRQRASFCNSLEWRNHIAMFAVDRSRSNALMSAHCCCHRISSSTRVGKFAVRGYSQSAKDGTEHAGLVSKI